MKLHCFKTSLEPKVVVNWLLRNVSISNSYNTSYFNDQLKSSEENATRSIGYSSRIYRTFIHTLATKVSLAYIWDDVCDLFMSYLRSVDTMKSKLLAKLIIEVIECEFYEHQLALIELLLDKNDQWRMPMYSLLISSRVTCRLVESTVKVTISIKANYATVYPC